MAPKKKQAQKMNLVEFMEDETLGQAPASWADDDMTLPPPPSGRGGGYGGGYGGSGGFGNDRTASSWTSNRSGPLGGGGDDFGGARRGPPRDREVLPVPDVPPFTARLQNLDYSVVEADIEELFSGPDYKLKVARVPRDMANNRARGFGFAEFEDKQSLEKALLLDGTRFRDRDMYVMVSDRPANPDERFGGDWRAGSGPLSGSGDFGGRGGPRIEEEDNRDYDNWERRGPLPGRSSSGRTGFGGDRFGGDRFGGDRFGGDRPLTDPARDIPEDNRDYNNWERRGPLPPREGQRRSSSRSEQPDDERDYDNWERRGPLSVSRQRPAFGGSRAPRSDVAPDTADTWRRPSGDDTKTDRTPSGRPRIQLKPRSENAGEASAPSSRSSSVFGNAKPVQTKTVEVEARGRASRAPSAKVEQVRQGFSVLSTDDENETKDSTEDQVDKAEA